MYQPYVYNVYDTVTAMYYIGSKTSEDCNPDNTRNYYGSPRHKSFREAIKTRPETLVKTVIAVCQTKKDAIAFEARLHKELDVKNDPMSYNMANQTDAGFTSNNKGRKMSEEQKAKLSAAKVGKPAPNLGKKLKPLSEEHRSKISKANLGNSKSEEHKANMRKPKTLEHRANISAARKLMARSKKL